MVTNNIMMKMKNKEDAGKVSDLLKSMLGQIDTLIDVKVGMNVGGAPFCYDLIYISKFNDQEGSAKYVSHPVHVEVSKQLGEYVESMVMVTYED